jgi:hypothetical protein
LALRLRDAGLSNELIAACLAVEREALDLLLQVAEAKLAAILGMRTTDVRRLTTHTQEFE